MVNQFSFKIEWSQSNIWCSIRESTRKKIIMLEKYILAINTIGNSGNDSIDTIFKLCVFILVDIADFFGISYEAVNIIIFIIIQPSLITVFKTISMLTPDPHEIIPSLLS